MKTAVQILLAAVCIALIPARARAIDATVHVTLSTSIRDLTLTPIDHDETANQTATGRPAVLVPTSLSIADAYGPGTTTADASGQAGLLRCRTTSTYPYVVPSFTEGGGSSADATIEVVDYITVTSPTLPAGTVVTLSVKMTFRGTISATSQQQARPGIDTQFQVAIRAMSSVDDQLDGLTYPIKPIRDLSLKVKAKVGETFLLRYSLDSTTYLVGGIPDIRSVTSDVYSADNMAVVTLSPLDPDNVAFTPSSGAPYTVQTNLPPTPTGLPPFVSESQAELAGGLDADGDGLEDFLVVDKPSGLRRLGIQQADGSFVWTEPASTGIENLTGLGIGRFAIGTAAEGFAVASPTGNRVMVFSDASGGPVIAPSTGVGPNLVVGLNFSGDARDDLVVGTKWDKGLVFTHLSGLVSDAGGLSSGFGSREETGPLSRGNRARFAADRPWMVGALRDAGGGKEFVTRPVFGFPGFVDGPTLGGLAVDTEWVWGQFQTNDFARFLFFSPGSSNLFVPELTEPVAYRYAWTNGITYDFGRTIARVLVLPKADGAMLVVVFADESSAGVYDFDGSNPPVLKETVTAPAGKRISIGSALGGGDFVLLMGAQGGTGASTDWQHWGFDGTHHKLVASGALPSLKVSQARANVLLFSSSPDLDSDAMLIQTFRVGDWSDGAVLGGGMAHVTREQFLGSALGLGSTSATDVPVPPLAFFSSVNQRASADSIAVFEPPTVAVFPELTFSPPTGTYHQAPGSGLKVRIVSAAGGPVQFRTNPAQPWTPYNASNPPQLLSTATIEAFVDSISPGPIRAATYTLAAAPAIAVAPPVDANHNGLPDPWEQAFDLTDPQGDPDGDGATNLQEYLAGTDPLDPASKPRTDLGSVSLVIRLPGSGAPADTICEITWPASVTGVVLETTGDIGSAGSWAAVLGTVVTAGAEQLYYEPESAGHVARYYRLHSVP